MLSSSFFNWMLPLTHSVIGISSVNGYHVVTSPERISTTVIFKHWSSVSSWWQAIFLFFILFVESYQLNILVGKSERGIRTRGVLFITTFHVAKNFLKCEI